MIFGYILTYGALGLLAFDEGGIYVLLVAFGHTGGKDILDKNIIDSYGHFETYGYWNHVLFLITLAASGLAFIIACAGHYYTESHIKGNIYTESPFKGNIYKYIYIYIYIPNRPLKAIYV